MSNSVQSSQTKKSRRKLPLTPEQLNPATNQKLRSRSADSRAKTENEGTKERLKKHLRNRELQRRGGSSSEKSEDEEDSSDASVASSRLYSSTKFKPFNRQRSTSFGAHEKPVVFPSSRARSGNRTSRLEEFLNSKPNHKLIVNKADIKNYESSKQNYYNKYKTGQYSRENLVRHHKSPKVEMVTIHGIQVPLAIKSLKQRIREELQIVTASRRLRLDEEEEVRRMEAELAEREKKRFDRRGMHPRSYSPDYYSYRDEFDHGNENIKKYTRDKKNNYMKDKRTHHFVDRGYQQEERNYYKDNTDIRFKNKNDDQYLKVLNKSKPAFKRQNSDPLLANNSFNSETISSDKTSYATKRNRLSSKYPYDSHDHKNDYRYDNDYHRSYIELDNSRNYMDTSRSSHQLNKLDNRMLSSRSACNLYKNNPYYSNQNADQMGGRNRFNRTPSFSCPDENEDPATREEKKEQLRLEIELRKLQLEEAKYIQEQIRRLAAMPDISSNDLNKVRSMYRNHKQLQEQLMPRKSYADLASQKLSYEAALHNDYLANLQNRPLFSKTPFLDSVNYSQYYPPTHDYPYKPYYYNYDRYQSTSAFVFKYNYNRVF